MGEVQSNPNQSNDLLMAVVQAQDAEIAREALEKLGMTVERLPSVGGFLGRRNALLLIGLPTDKREAAEEILHENCRQRVEFIAVPLESAPLPLPTPTPITVGGATVFALDVEYYEEI
ncbi:MAG TPA: cyclic-di-AMP receptor [Anaerolinea sp.]|nr:cyclic-di-AMP receptor [Anaerolinea sp.]